jgi:NADH-quinone oxidoreductase subunit C
MSSVVLDSLKAHFSDDLIEFGTFRGDDFAIVKSAAWLSIATFLRDDAGCDMSMFVDITCVDYPTRQDRFEVVLLLYSLDHGHRIRLKTRLKEGESVATVTGLWRAANWFEREVWDMFGVPFAGHPDLRRILMYPEFEGHPLRKDYDARKTQPIVPYRESTESLSLEKQAPFADDEGMPFPRNDFTPRE